MHEDFQETFRYARVMGWGGLLLLAAIYLASGFYVVRPEQRGVVQRFGAVTEDDVPPGIHYRLSYPFEKVSRLRYTEIRTLKVQFRDTSNVSVLERGGALLTGDENQVWMVVALHYTVKNSKQFLFTTENPELMLNRITQALLVGRVAGLEVDDALTAGRQKLQIVLKDEIQRMADTYELGVLVSSVQILSIEPPAKVAQAFKDVASAREDMHKMLQEAEGERNRVLPKARADAEAMAKEAQAYANEMIQMAKGDSERFLSTWREYRKAKDVTARRLYLETIESIMPSVRKLIINPEAEKFVPSGRVMQ